MTDTTGAHVNGVWVEDGPGTTRTVSAIVLAMSFEELQFYAEGDSSAAGITLTTDEELFFTDINAEGLERRQSYVEYGRLPFPRRRDGVHAKEHLAQHLRLRPVLRMSGPLTKTLTVDAVNTLLADYLTSVFQWEAGRVVVETQAGPRPPSGVYATLWWKGQELLQQGMGDFTLRNRRRTRASSPSATKRSVRFRFPSGGRTPTTSPAKRGMALRLRNAFSTSGASSGSPDAAR